MDICFEITLGKDHKITVTEIVHHASSSLLPTFQCPFRGWGGTLKITVASIQMTSREKSSHDVEDTWERGQRSVPWVPHPCRLPRHPAYSHASQQLADQLA